MVPRIRIGRRALRALVFFPLALINIASAQTPSSTGLCAVSSAPVQVRAEGITEKLGDVLFHCSGYSPGSVISGNLTLFYPVTLTNRIDANNNALDAALQLDSGGGYIPTATPGTLDGENITFQGLSLTVPANGSFNLKISNVRGAAYQMGLAPSRPINAYISSPFTLNMTVVVVGYPQRSLLGTLYSSGIPCTGSPIPDVPSLATLFAAKTALASTRITEGIANAFLTRGPGDDTGARFIVHYSGFPSNATVYVPDFVAGSDAPIPTMGGDLGGTQSGGQTASGTLLLARVQFTDSDGVGGIVMSSPVGGGVFNTVNPVPLTNGAGIVVYEVIDSNPTTIESAQFPTFIAIPSVTATATAQETISYAPVSTTIAASANAPVPRFAPVTPTSDCSLVGDCQAGYFPKLTASASSDALKAVAGNSSSNQVFIAIQNTGGGILNWSANVTYNQDSGWLTLAPSSGLNGGTIIVVANARGLAAGTYTATITVTAGPLAGSAALNVTLTVQAPPGNPGGTNNGDTGSKTPVTVSSVVNAASLAPGPLVGGSLTTVMGSNLMGKDIAVTFDGAPAKLLYTSASQINLQVPVAVASEASSSMVVTVDGVSSAPQTLPVSPAWPAIFSNGVLNQDWSVNGPGAGAKAGDVLQIFLTGMPTNATVTAIVGAQMNLTPLYAGEAPGSPGVQQVNVAIPAGTGGGGSTQVAVCATTGGRQFCSTGLPLYMK